VSESAVASSTTHVWSGSRPHPTAFFPHTGAARDDVMVLAGDLGYLLSLYLISVFAFYAS